MRSPPIVLRLFSLVVVVSVIVVVVSVNVVVVIVDVVFVFVVVLDVDIVVKATLKVVVVVVDKIILNHGTAGSNMLWVIGLSNCVLSLHTYILFIFNLMVKYYLSNFSAILQSYQSICRSSQNSSCCKSDDFNYYF